MEPLSFITRFIAITQGKSVFHRILSHTIIMVALTLIAAMMIVISFIIGLYSLYATCIYCGMEHYHALMISFAASVICALLLCLFTYKQSSRLKAMRQRSLSPLHIIVDSFLEGFMHSPSSPDQP